MMTTTSQGRTYQRGILGIRVQEGQTVSVNGNTFTVLMMDAKHAMRTTVAMGRLAIVRDARGLKAVTIWSNQQYRVEE